jgi:hypothetical protein
VVASVDGSGLVTAATPGSTTIQATSEGRTGTSGITVREGALIGSAGGQAVAFSGNVTVVVPAQALSASVPISVVAATNPPPHPTLVAGTAYDFGPNGIQFAQPITLNIRYSASQPVGANPAQFRIARLTGTAWTALPGGSVNVATRTVSGQTTSFSTYGVIEVLPPVASVVIVGSLRVKVGDDYTYTAVARLADGSIVVRPTSWGILETPKGSMTAGGTLRPSQTGTITLLAIIDGVVWEGTTTAYDWVSLSGGGSFFASLLSDTPITNKFGTSEFPELVHSCSSDGTFFIWVDTESFVTESGLVAYSFDGGTIFTGTWIEFDLFSALGHPGPTNFSKKSFALTMALSRTFGFAFSEFNGPAKAMIFRVTGLTPVLNPLIAACPSNGLMASTDAGRTSLERLLAGVRQPSQMTPERQLRRDLGSRVSAIPQPSMRFAPPSSQEAIRRP